MVPGARVGHIGLYRDPKTLVAVEYYFKMPSGMKERDAIVLAYFGGRTYREVATQLSIPEGTAKSRIRLGLAKLASHLEAAGLGVQT